MISHFPIDRFVDELFDVISCYFPITFNPPPNDPIGLPCGVCLTELGITKMDLVVALRKCLAASPAFAPACMEMLLEKLGSSMESSKV
jgi:DNA repair/transcription protein MET18/MMS19